MPRPRTHPGRKALAYHEAGHAVVGYVLGLEIEQVTINPSETSLGQCRYRGWDDEEAGADLDTQLLFILAGAVAEEIAMGAASRSADERKALGLARLRDDSEEEAARRAAGVRWLTARFLERHWPVVKALAMALRKHRDLDGPQATGIIDRAFRKLGVPSPSTVALLQKPGNQKPGEGTHSCCA
jgi:Peptidase family M41